MTLIGWNASAIDCYYSERTTIVSVPHVLWQKPDGGTSGSHAPSKNVGSTAGKCSQIELRVPEQLAVASSVIRQRGRQFSSFHAAKLVL